ncbi:MAG: class II glutamine amidotransferase [Porticoccaceae bacterium]|jgi:glutamine amidotransferase
MCQLLGINSAKPIAPHFSLRGFFRRGGGTDHHGDGWGLAYYHGSEPHLEVRDTAADRCGDAQALLNRPFRSTNIIAHIRRATIGGVNVRNSHPFCRRLWQRDWIFAHNGDLKGFAPRHRGCYLPRGETDSEKAFCHLLSALLDHFGPQAPDTDSLLAHIAAWSAEIARHGSFNFLLSDGDLLVAHCSTELYWTARAAPFTRIELLDEDHHIDLLHHNDDDDQIVVVATRPLTRGEAWNTMGAGELRAFTGGDEYRSEVTGRPQLRSPPRPPLASGGEAYRCSTGWRLGTATLA